MQQEQCTECNKELPSNARFCPGCGQAVENANGNEAAAPADAGNKRRDVLIIMGIVLVVVTGYWFMRDDASQAETTEAVGPPGHEEIDGGVMANLPTDYAGLIDVGNRTMDEGNFPLAAESYSRALAIDGQSPDVRTDYGACLQGMGLPARALEEFRMVMTEHPEHAIVRFNMGIVHYSQGQLDSARYYWEEFIGMAPDSGPAEAARGYLQDMGS